MLTVLLGIIALVPLDSQDLVVKLLPVLCVAVATVTTMELVAIPPVPVWVTTSLHTAN
jgi:hypothetical protein